MMLSRVEKFFAGSLAAASLFNFPADIKQFLPGLRQFVVGLQLALLISSRASRALFTPADDFSASPRKCLIFIHVPSGIRP